MHGPKVTFSLCWQQIRVYLGWWSVLVAAVALLVARRARDLSATLPVFPSHRDGTDVHGHAKDDCRPSLLKLAFPFRHALGLTWR